MLTQDELNFLRELCMIEMARIATVKGIQNTSEIKRFQLAKSAGMKIEQMMKEESI